MANGPQYRRRLAHARRAARSADEIHADTGRKVTIVGWSLGGVYARDLALQAPDMVRYVVTLGSPFANDVRATNATRLYEALSGETVEDNSELQQAIAGDLPVPATSIYSTQRRHRELANLPACAPPIPPRISRCTSPAMSGSASMPQRSGRWPIVWR